MLSTTRGIVFKYLKYSETSIIVKVFTEKFGLQSYMVKGARSKRSKNKLAFFQPLNQVEIVAFQKENKSIKNLKEVRMLHTYQSIPFDIEKRSILMFLDELMFRSVKEETPNKALFEWLMNSLTVLDLTTKKVINFHLVFMMQLSRFLGFYPKQTPGQSPSYFDLQEGQFCLTQPNHPQIVGKVVAEKLLEIHQTSFESSPELELTNDERRKLAEILVTYYRLHLPGFGEMKSLLVLKEILA